MRRLLVIAAMLAAGGPARADDDPGTRDARDDVVEMRHHRMPARHALLGWTTDGAAVIRRTDCDVQDDSGFPFCGVTITIARAGRDPDLHSLFSEMENTDGASCCAIDTATAMKFIRGERDLRAALGPLAPGIAERGAFHLGPAPLALRADGPTGDLIATWAGRDRVVATLWDHSDGDRGTRAAEITDVLTSQDGARVVAIVEEHTGGDDFFETVYHAAVVDVPRPGARWPDEPAPAPAPVPTPPAP